MAHSTDTSGNVGVILAGGRSSRMGESKAAMLFGGEPLLRRVVHRLSDAVDDILIIGPGELDALVPGMRVIPDVVPGIGPLGGLYTALRSTTAARIFLVACDMPFVQPTLVRAMLATSIANPAAGAVILGDQRGGARVQPLHAVYTRACLPAVGRALDSAEHSLRTLLLHLTVATMDAETVRREDPTGHSTYNINTPGDLAAALRIAADAEAIEQS